MSHPFRTTLFALLESFVPGLLEGPEAHSRYKGAAVPPQASASAVGVFGVLGPGADWFTDSSYENIRAGVRRVLGDSQAKTVDIFIDSPGGSVQGLPETASVIREAGKIKPVRAFVTGIAASAAYWLAAQASTIHLMPSGEVGSVGVLDIHTDISEALAKDGLKVTAVTAGEYKAERVPFTTLSDDAKAHMQRGVDEWYAQFLTDIRRGRGARVSHTSNYGGGRMLSAKDALAQGLVDFVRPI